MSFFKDKTKRIAHTPKFNSLVSLSTKVVDIPGRCFRTEDSIRKSADDEVSRKRKYGQDGLEDRGTCKLLASGSVTPGTILSNSKFRKLSKGYSLIANQIPMAMTMILRKLEINFTYNERVLVDLYLNHALAVQIHDAFLKSTKEERKNEKFNDGNADSSISSQIKFLMPKKIHPEKDKIRKWMKSNEVQSTNKGRDSDFNNDSNFHNQAPSVNPTSSYSYWVNSLNSTKNVGTVAPVEYFTKAPLADIWHSLAKPGLAIEVRNPFVEDGKIGDAYWIGRIVYFAGYFGLVEFVSFDNAEDAPGYLTWISFCSDVPKPLKWCSKNGIDLNPGLIISELTSKKYNIRLLNFYEREQTNTIEQNHTRRIYDSIRSLQPFHPAIPVEALKLDDLRFGRISAQVGNRINIKFFTDDLQSKLGNEDYWFTPYNCDFDMVQPVGWGASLEKVVGEEIEGSSVESQVTIKELFWRHHRSKRTVSPRNQTMTEIIMIETGMKLEARHPMLPHKIVGAIVVKALSHNYFVVETREKDKTTRVVCQFHLTSPFIFPWGWCAQWGISTDVDIDCSSPILLDSDSRCSILRLDLLPKRKPHKFVRGLKLEALRVLNPQLCHPATVIQVADHLLLIHLDNTEFIDENQMWVDVEFSDIYPIGYGELVGLKFQG